MSTEVDLLTMIFEEVQKSNLLLERLLIATVVEVDTADGSDEWITQAARTYQAFIAMLETKGK